MSHPPQQDKDEESPRPPPPESSCHFYIVRKHRYCRFHPANNSQYCAEHAVLFGVNTGRERVFCPYNTKHTCYAEKLKRHMKICPSRPMKQPAYYSEGINSGSDETETVPNPKETVLTIPVDELQELIDKVERLYEEHVADIPLEVLTHACMKKELENPSYGTAAIRHRKQQASLIGQMEAQGLLTDHRCFVEMGAGKGQLTHWLHGAVVEKSDIGFVLIDRSHVRNKMDNLHKEEMIMDRIRIDIEHLKLEHIPSIEDNDRSVVAYGKHLCGPATDLALRCMTSTLNQGTRTSTVQDEPGTGESDDGVESPRKRLKSESNRGLAGAVIALCCHHRCEWKPYVGKRFFQDTCGLSARDFQVISSMTSWATCAWKGWSYQRKMEAEKLRDTETLTTDTDLTENVDGSGKMTVGSQSNTSEITATSENNDSGSTLSVGGTLTKCETSSGVKQKQFEDNSASENTGSVPDAGHGDSKSVGTEVTVKDTAAVDFDEEDDGHLQDESITSKGCKINEKLSQEEREVIGRKCKRLIDVGRVHYLQKLGMSSMLKAYIEEFYTPENVVLVASS